MGRLEEIEVDDVAGFQVEKKQRGHVMGWDKVDVVVLVG